MALGGGGAAHFSVHLSILGSDIINLLLLAHFERARMTLLSYMNSCFFYCLLLMRLDIFIFIIFAFHLL